MVVMSYQSLSRELREFIIPSIKKHMAYWWKRAHVFKMCGFAWFSQTKIHQSSKTCGLVADLHVYKRIP